MGSQVQSSNVHGHLIDPLNKTKVAGVAALTSVDGTQETGISIGPGRQM
jgi:hypothetical protein